MLQVIFGIILITFSFVETFLVLSRNLFRYTILGYVEMSGIFSCIVMLIGLHICTLARNHVTVDFIPVLQSDSYRNFINKVNFLLFLVTFIILFLGSLDAFFINYKSKNLTQVYRIPVYLYQITIAFLLGVSIVEIIRKLINRII